MRLRLRESVSHVFEQCRGHFSFPESRLQTFLARLDREPVAPLAFSFYCDLVLAVENDDLDEAAILADQLLTLPEHSGGPRIIELGDPATDLIARRYVRFVDTDPQMPLELFAPSPAVAEACRNQIAGAFALMESADPELALEIRALLREIILAAGSTDPQALTFDGASSFMLWGAIVLNANRAPGELGMVQMLAHESAHNLLFGMATDEPLLFNDPEERYASPLRPDPRPLEGIYHATFVSARMYRSIKSILEHGSLTPELQTQARTDLEADARCFVQGCETIRRHGQLTPIGDLILQNVSRYMRENGVTA